MGKMEGCECCTIIDGEGSGFRANNYIVELEGGWVLNHCGGENTYLGYLILQTKCHRVDFGDLSPEEAKSLGMNIKRINDSIRKYWESIYPEDQVELVHVAYLNETPYIRRHIYLSNRPQLSRESHVHIHLLTRTRKMGEALGYCAEKIGWHLLDNVSRFPPNYLNIEEDDTPVVDLMDYLKKSLGV